MSDNILSNDELAALLESVEEEEAAPKRSHEKRISDYDFVRPDKLSGDQLRSLQRMHEQVAQHWAMRLSSYLRDTVEVELISIGQLTFDVFRNSLANPTFINILSLDPLEDRAICTVDMKLAFSLIDRMLGGTGSSLEDIRPLTYIEQSLMDNVVSSFLASFRQGWEGLLEFTPSVESREMDPQSLQVIPSSEMVMIISFNLSAEDVLEPGEISFCLPFLCLDPIMDKLGGDFKFAVTRRKQTQAQRKHIEQVLGRSTLPVTAVLGGSDLTVGEVLALETGDVLVLDTLVDQALPCQIADLVKVSGRPGRSGRRVGLLIEEVAPDGVDLRPPKPHLMEPVLKEPVTADDTRSPADRMAAPTAETPEPPAEGGDDG